MVVVVVVMVTDIVCSGDDIVTNFVDFVGFQIKTVCSFFKMRFKKKLHMCLKTQMQQA